MRKDISAYGQPRGRMVAGSWKTFPQEACVRGVVTANIATLASFTVASNDGLTYAEGEYVLLATQTTAADCGVYVVGVVAAGVAPLTRAPEWPTGDTIDNGCMISVSEGTLWQGSTWKAMCTGSAKIGTNDPVFYPGTIHRTITLASGTFTLGAGGDGVATPVFSVTKSQVTALRNTANTSTATTGGYASPAASRVAGKAGTGAILIQAQVAAGTISNADVSTLDVVITNW